MFQVKLLRLKSSENSICWNSRNSSIQFNPLPSLLFDVAKVADVIVGDSVADVNVVAVVATAVAAAVVVVVVDDVDDSFLVVFIVFVIVVAIVATVADIVTSDNVAAVVAESRQTPCFRMKFASSNIFGSLIIFLQKVSFSSDMNATIVRVFKMRQSLIKALTSMLDSLHVNVNLIG